MTAAGSGVLGVERRRLLPVLRALRPQDAALSEGREDDHAVALAFARAAWTGIAEPGDRVAGESVAAFGADAALLAVLERRPVPHGPESPGGPEWQEALKRWGPRLQAEPVLRGLGVAARLGARLLLPGDSEWPAGLDDLGPHAPIALWCRGGAERLSALRSIAVVGTRAATGYGEHVAAELAGGLAERGVTVVSGGAYGIDGVAHRAALAAEGSTAAFLAGGIDRLYPAGHESLLRRVIEHGAVLAEPLPGTSPSRWRFLQRNRLIAAAAAAVVVVEAGWRSGALNTTAHAAALGRPVAAVPGPVTSPSSAGCHRLLRDHGAHCVTGTEDLLALLPASPAHAPDASRAGRPLDERDPIEIRVHDALSSRSARSPAQLARSSGLAIEQVLTGLGLLELAGAAIAVADGWRRAPGRR